MAMVQMAAFMGCGIQLTVAPSAHKIKGPAARTGIGFGRG